MEVTWENQAQPARQLWYEADAATGELLQPAPETFVTACLPLAQFHREERLYVEGALCLRLARGLRFIGQVFQDWYPKLAPPRLEASDGLKPTYPPGTPRVGSLLSGGVDGLATLRQNRLDYPLEHPESIRDCLCLFGYGGFDCPEGKPDPRRLEVFQQAAGRLEALGKQENFTLHTLRTNVRSLAPHYRYWTMMGFGAAHCAGAQLFQGTLGKVLFASDGDGHNPPPGAVHPLFNHHFSTDALTIESEGDATLRLEKISLIADWEAGRRLMNPCHMVKLPSGGRINCGRCEKCVRTMLALQALGKLPEVSAFVENELPPSRLFRIPVNNVRKAQLLSHQLPVVRAAGLGRLEWALRLRLLLFHLLRR